MIDFLKVEYNFCKASKKESTEKKRALPFETQCWEHKAIAFETQSFMQKLGALNVCK